MNAVTLPFASRVFLAAALLASIGVSPTSAQQSQRQPPERPPVRWVNAPPEGTGLEHRVLASEAMGHDVGYVVWTPPSYASETQRRFPVVYFLHGMGGNESADAAGFSGLLARGVEAGDAPPAICVFPNGGRSGYRGEASRMIVEELVPLIDETFRTLTGPGHRVVAGFSMGGQGAVRLTLMNPGLFGAAGSWGGGFRRGGAEVVESVRRDPTPLLDAGVRLLLVNGDRDRPDAYADLTPALEEVGISFAVETPEDTPHNLGRYYAVAGDAMVRFLGERLSEDH